MLLGFEAVHVHRQLSRRDDVGKKDEFPAGELRAIAKIEILVSVSCCQPPALLDAGTPPQPGRSVEIEKAAASAARGLFEQKMSIQETLPARG